MQQNLNDRVRASHLFSLYFLSQYSNAFTDGSKEKLIWSLPSSDDPLYCKILLKSLSASFKSKTRIKTS